MIFRVIFFSFLLLNSVLFSEDVLPEKAAATEGQETEYSLVQCLLMALEKNPTCKKLALDQKIAQWELHASSSGFEWMLNSSTVYDSVDDTRSETLGISKDFLTGTSVGLSTTASERSTKSGSNGSAITINIAQELLSGASRMENQMPMYRAGIKSEQADNRLEDQIRTTLYKVSINYFQYIKSIETIKINENALKQAKKFLETVQELKKAGKGTSLDIATAEVQVASREEAVLRSRTSIANALDLLKRSIGIEMDESFAVSKELSLDAILPKLTYAEACKHALENRSDVIVARLGFDLQNREVLVKRRAKKPNLRLSYSATYSDVGDDFVDSYRYSDQPEHMLSLQFSTPLLRKQKIADFMEAKLSAEKVELDLWELEQGVRLDIKRVMRELEENIKTIEVQKQRLATEETRVKSFETKFENGLIDSLEVTRAYDDLDKARIDLISSQLSLKILVAEFHVVIGSVPTIIIENEKNLLEKKPE